MPFVGIYYSDIVIYYAINGIVLCQCFYLLYIPVYKKCASLKDFLENVFPTLMKITVE